MQGLQPRLATAAVRSASFLSNCSYYLQAIATVPACAFGGRIFFPYFHHDSTMSTEAPKENTRPFQPLDAAAPATEGVQNLLLNLEEFFHIGHGMG